MAEYLIQEETLTNLASKIRVLNGTEESMTPAVMNSELASANDEVDTQSALIDQLSELLDGKASGGGSGSGSGSMETCTVQIIFDSFIFSMLTGFYIKHEDGVDNPKLISTESSVSGDESNIITYTLTNVLCGSLISIFDSYGALSAKSAVIEGNINFAGEDWGTCAYIANGSGTITWMTY